MIVTVPATVRVPIRSRLAVELFRIGTLASTWWTLLAILVAALVTLAPLLGGLTGSQDHAWREAHRQVEDTYVGQPLPRDQEHAALDACRRATLGSRTIDPADCPAPAGLAGPAAFYTDPATEAAQSVRDGTAGLAAVVTVVLALLSLQQVGSDWSKGSLPAVLAASGRPRRLALLRCVALGIAGAAGTLLAVGTFTAAATVVSMVSGSGAPGADVPRVLVLAVGAGLLTLLTAGLAMLARGVVAALAVLSVYLFVIDGFLLTHVLPMPGDLSMITAVLAVLRNGTEVFRGAAPLGHLSAAGGLAVLAGFAAVVLGAVVIRVGHRDLIPRE